ncbi:DUF3618 domain-containing protein [Streptomyces sp. NBC_01707]|uniref:DUF3618 domain-containing protein n=1 Tax=Streptomyces sp. NBC_01707 TaxID=2975914 RepID=UPI00352CFBD7
MSESIDQLADRASPGQMVRRRRQRVRGALSGLRDRVMGTVADSTGTVHSRPPSRRRRARARPRTPCARRPDRSAMRPAGSVRQSVERRSRPCGRHRAIRWGLAWLLSVPDCWPRPCCPPRRPRSRQPPRFPKVRLSSR